MIRFFCTLLLVGLALASVHATSTLHLKGERPSISWYHGAAITRGGADTLNVTSSLNVTNATLIVNGNVVSNSPKVYVVGEPGAAAYENSYQAYSTDPDWGKLSYMKDSYGMVHLFGLYHGGPGSIGSIFTLPEGYRPPRRVIIFGASNAGICRLDVLSSGVVFSQSCPNSGVSSAVFVSLTGTLFATF